MFTILFVSLLVTSEIFYLRFHSIKKFRNKLQEIDNLQRSSLLSRLGSGAFTETVLESSWQGLEVTHAASAGGSSSLSLGTPFDCSNTGIRQRSKWYHKYRSNLQDLILAPGYPQLAQVFFCLWKETFPQRRQEVWVLVWRLPKLWVPLVYRSERGRVRHCTQK